MELRSLEITDLVSPTSNTSSATCCDLSIINLVERIQSKLELKEVDSIVECNQASIQRENYSCGVIFSWSKWRLVILSQKTERESSICLVEDVIRVLLKVNQILGAQFGNGLVLEVVELEHCVRKLDSSNWKYAVEFFYDNAALTVCLLEGELEELLELFPTDYSTDSHKLALAELSFELIVVPDKQREPEAKISKGTELGFNSISLALYQFHGNQRFRLLRFSQTENEEARFSFENIKNSETKYGGKSMELGLHVRLGKVKLGLEELLSLQRGALLKVDWGDERSVELWFDDQCLADGTLKCREQTMYFNVSAVRKEQYATKDIVQSSNTEQAVA